MNREQEPCPPADDASRPRANSYERGARPVALALGTPAAREASRSFWSSAMLQQQLARIVQCAKSEQGGARSWEGGGLDSGTVSSKCGSQESLELPPIAAARRPSLSAPPTPTSTRPRPLPASPSWASASPPASLRLPSSPSRQIRSVPRRGSVFSTLPTFLPGTGYTERLMPSFLSPTLVRRAQPVTPPRTRSQPLTPPLRVQGQRFRFSPKPAPLTKPLKVAGSAGVLLKRRGSEDSATDDGFHE